jgi:hypothetical protein
VPVKVSTATRYKNTNGNSMTKVAFFEALAAGSKVVKVEGIYKDGLFSPGKAELKASGGNN